MLQKIMLQDIKEENYIEIFAEKIIFLGCKLFLV